MISEKLLESLPENPFKALDLIINDFHDNFNVGGQTTEDFVEAFIIIECFLKSRNIEFPIPSLKNNSGEDVEMIVNFIDRLLKSIHNKCISQTTIKWRLT